MKKTLPYILSVSLFVYLIIVFTFASAKLREVKCEGLQVVVDGTEENAFIDETEVLGIIKRGYGDIEGCNIVSVDKDSLEHILVRNSVIKSAQVYYTLDGYFHVEITQRKPVLRIMSGEGYYVDEDGKIMLYGIPGYEDGYTLVNSRTLNSVTLIPRLFIDGIPAP